MALMRWTILLRLLLPLLFCPLCFPTVVPASSRAQIVVPDTLCLPGEEIFIGAYLERTGLLRIVRPGIQGELLEFFDADGRRLAALLTDASGYARMAYRAARPGLVSLEVRLAKTGRVHAEPASGRVFIRKKKHPLFFATVEDALSKKEESPGLFPRPLESAEPRVDSKEILERAAACSTLVYLTGFPRNRLNELRGWLTGHSFPEAPILLLESAPDPNNPAGPTLSTDLFSSLRNKKTDPAVLVTGNAGLASLAAKAQVEVYLLEKKGPDDPPPEDQEGESGIRTVMDWKEISTPCGRP
jgi:hypothetical protein